MHAAATQKLWVTFAAVLLLGAIALNFGGLVTYVTHGRVDQHWSRAAVGGILALLAFQFLAAAVLDRTLRLLAASRAG